MNGNDLLYLIIYIFSGFIIGLIIHKVIMPALSKLTKKTQMKFDDLIIDTICKWVIPWFLALGLYLGLRRLEMGSLYQLWLENAVIIFYIISATFISAKIVSGMVSIRSSDSDTIIPSSSIVGNIIRAIIYAVGLLIILQSQGISVTPILTALGVGGLAVALALQGTLSNLFAGLQLISSGKINTGDYVKLSSGEEGFIQDITWRNTSIRAVSDHLIIVPNAKLADMTVLNFSLPAEEVGFAVEVGVSYDSDLDHVERVTAEVITETMNEVEGGIKDFEPIIRFYGFGDSSINLRAILRVKEYSNQFLVKTEFIKRLHKRYNQEGINIPFPIRTVYMKKDD